MSCCFINLLYVRHMMTACMCQIHKNQTQILTGFPARNRFGNNILLSPFGWYSISWWIRLRLDLRSTVDIHLVHNFVNVHVHISRRMELHYKMDLVEESITSGLGRRPRRSTIRSTFVFCFKTQSRKSIGFLLIQSRSASTTKFDWNRESCLGHPTRNILANIFSNKTQSTRTRRT